MRMLLVAAFIAAMPVHAAGHCYAIWHYPTPQRCGVRTIPSGSVRIRPALPPARPKDDSIPLPDLSAREFVSGPVDDVTRARLELLGYAHAH